MATLLEAGRKAVQAHDRARLEFEQATDLQNRDVDEFEASYRRGDNEAVVAYNEMVLGNDLRCCLIAVRAKRKSFLELDLHRIDLLACLKGLGARLSKRPDELLPVEPVIPYGVGRALRELESVSWAPRGSGR